MQANGIRGVHVFWIIAGFFAVTFAVNAFFITKAVTSFPGEDEKKSYLQGIDYNATLLRREAQSRLGWSAQVGFDEDDKALLVVRIRQATGASVAGLQVTARVRTAGDAEEPAVQQLTEIRDGEYRALVKLVGPRGEVQIEARKPGDESVQFEAHKSFGGSGPS